MKSFFSVLFWVFCAVQVIAQVPLKLSYQAVVRNGSNQLVLSQQVGMRISILQGSANGTPVYAETQTTITNANGLVSVEIGGGTVVIGNVASINWANGPYFIKTETDPAGGTNYTITGKSQLLSVPYALYAANAGTASGGGNFTHYIGEKFGGGVIYHLWKDSSGVEHGLIVDKSDLSVGHVWSNRDQTLIGTTAQSSWDGLSNSNAIIGQASHTSSAAALCLNSTNGGQSDWYLPSLDELSLLWHSRFNVNKTLSTINGATVLPFSAYYWSSTEFNATNSWFVYFSDGDTNETFKTSTGSVRAVRTF